MLRVRILSVKNSPTLTFPKTATEPLQEIFRTRLNLPEGKLGAIAAVIDHLPPKGKQTVCYYGLYSNKNRGQQSLIPADPDPDWFDQSPAWKPEEIHLEVGRTLVLGYT